MPTHRPSYARPLAHLHVVAIRYRNDRPAPNDERGLNAYAAAGVYADAGVPFQVVEPRLPESERTSETTANLGLLGGQVAAAVAEGRRARHAILVTGGDCTHITGIVGGLQDAHGAGVRVGLVWFDAHGDFNTPRTTLSGMLGGMPVAVCAGLAFPGWREGSHIVAPLPTDRILMVDVRNLDPPEAALIQATDITLAAATPGRPGVALADAVQALASRCDLISLHVDSDILDASLVPSHGTREPDGPHLSEVVVAIDTVMGSGKVAVFTVMSVYGAGPGSEVSVQSALGLLRGGRAAWRLAGQA